MVGNSNGRSANTLAVRKNEILRSESARSGARRRLATARAAVRLHRQA